MTDSLEILGKWRVDQLNDLNGVAQFIKPYLQIGRPMLLSGEMGAGKTTFIKVLLNHLGSIDDVSSPTFSIINEYETGEGWSVAHFDLYRLKNVEELMDIGIETYLDTHVCMIEWPELAMDFIGDELLRLDIRQVEGVRIFTLSGNSPTN